MLKKSVMQLVAAVVSVDADHSRVKLWDQHHPAPQSFDTIFAAPGKVQRPMIADLRTFVKDVI